MRSQRIIRTVGFALVGLALSACLRPRVRSPDEASERAEALLQQRRLFTNAVLSKPKPGPDDSLAARLAPLMILEAPSNFAKAYGLGTMTAAGIDSSHPALYASEGLVQLGGQWHPEVRYAWGIQASNQAPIIGGIRIILDTTGTPILWEELADQAGLRRLYVSRSIEEAAAAQFGPPLAGRDYSIETDRNQRTSIVILRLLDDGPIPMGPMIYLQAHPLKITTVLCRCMPAQVRNIESTEEYDLWPRDALQEGNDGAAGSIATRAAHLLEREMDAEPLESQLRWPRR